VKKLNGLLFTRAVSVLLTINGKKTISAISKEIDLTYSHTIKIIKCLLQIGMITARMEGRCKIIGLTGSGKVLQNSLIIATDLTEIEDWNKYVD